MTLKLRQCEYFPSTKLTCIYVLCNLFKSSDVPNKSFLTTDTYKFENIHHRRIEKSVLLYNLFVNSGNLENFKLVPKLSRYTNIDSPGTETNNDTPSLAKLITSSVCF